MAAPALVGDRPSANPGMIVMIPACDEPELLNTIHSLACCEPPRCAVEVIVVVNEAEDCLWKISIQNDRKLEELRCFLQTI